MSDFLYFKQKKALRLLLKYDFFEGIDFNGLIESQFINQQKLIPPVKLKLKEYVEEERISYAKAAYLKLKEQIIKSKPKDIEGPFHHDFEIHRKLHTDVAIMIKPLPDPDAKKSYARGDLIFYRKNSEEYKTLRPEMAQRHFIYLRIKDEKNKEKAISKLKRAFRVFMKSKPKRKTKDCLTQKFIDAYNSLK